MSSFTNSRETGNTIRERHAAGVLRLQTAQIKLTPGSLPKYNPRGDLQLVGYIIDGQHSSLLLTRHQIAEALAMHPQGVWRWTQHPDFPAPIPVDPKDAPPRLGGRQPQFWDMDSVTVWARRHATQQRRFRHAYNWWLLEYQYGTWTPANGYSAQSLIERRRAEYEKKCADWRAKGLDPYGPNPPAELARLRAALNPGDAE